MSRIVPVCSAALALFLCATTASAQTVTTAAAMGVIAQIPVNNPMALALLLGALALAAWWHLRRGPAAQRVLAWLAVVTLGVAMHNGGLLAVPPLSFTSQTGETLSIPIVPTTSGTDFTGFQEQVFTNHAGTSLRVTGVVPPTQGQCFTAYSADQLLQPGTPSASTTPVCQAGTVLADGAACRVDVDAICRGLLGVAPTLASASPGSGPITGGTTVTLTGMNLTGALGVSFDGVPATSVNVVNANTVTAITPAHAVGAVDVAVKTPAGMVRLAGSFQYIVPAPTISSVTPNSGSSSGGTIVTLTGTNFTGATGVTFGGTPGTSFTVVNNTTINAVTPAHAAGAVDVVVTTAGGTGTSVGGFTYYDAPSISSISPTGGATDGGTVVTLTGTNLNDATGVSFGGTTGILLFVTNTTIMVITPSHAAGAVDVVVTTPGGTGTIVGGFTYYDAPSISSISPTGGAMAGGDTVTISGAGLGGTTSVTFGGIHATSFIVVSDSEIIAATPANVAGAVDVVVTTPGGTATASNGFTYYDAPMITSINPSQGSTMGGDTVTLTGAGFAGTTSVTFGGVPTSFTVNSDSTITAVTPLNALGPVDVTITGVGGSATVVGAFTYLID